MVAISLVEKGWAGARRLSIELSRKGVGVRHLVRGAIAPEFMGIITPYPGISIHGIPVRWYRIAAWWALLWWQFRPNLHAVIVDNARTSDWVAKTFPRVADKLVQVKETAAS